MDDETKKKIGRNAVFVTIITGVSLGVIILIIMAYQLVQGTSGF